MTRAFSALPECARPRTTSANALLAPIHDRMPVILAPGNWPAWLGEKPADVQLLKSLLVPYPPDDMVVWPVDKRVGDPKNKEPSLIEAPVSSSERICG